MCFLWGHIGGVRKEYKKYMFFKHLKSPKMRCRFHSNFKEYLVFKMKHIFDLHSLKTAESENARFRFFFGYGKDQNETRVFASKTHVFACGCFQTMQIRNMKTRVFASKTRVFILNTIYSLKLE